MLPKSHINMLCVVLHILKLSNSLIIKITIKGKLDVQFIEFLIFSMEIKAEVEEENIYKNKY